MAETLETIAGKIDALGRSMDERFAKVDERFAKSDERFANIDERFAKVDTAIAETKSHLGVKIEAVADSVLRVYDAVMTLTKRDVPARHVFCLPSGAYRRW